MSRDPRSVRELPGSRFALVVPRPIARNICPVATLAKLALAILKADAIVHVVLFRNSFVSLVDILVRSQCHIN